MTEIKFDKKKSEVSARIKIKIKRKKRKRRKKEKKEKKRIKKDKKGERIE